jgi:hypothetical protein
MLEDDGQPSPRTQTDDRAHKGQGSREQFKNEEVVSRSEGSWENWKNSREGDDLSNKYRRRTISQRKF